ncbi:MAG: hypothetical protein JJU34_07215 [Lunatimonas sp.]|uniref:hypothetical protein n=1 Tax=Lunatimonas sp. TaxID=2060141 RepID=UPI00263B2496|nr:hypothetical protein [Lunatimonas sp.]MCC5937053.1 hypothetical protein [Lunatimonas sp.]
MKKLVYVFLFALSFSAFGQDVINMDNNPERPGSIYQEHDAYQLDDTFSDVVTMTELKLADPIRMPIAVPPMGNYLNMTLKKLIVPDDPRLPAFESKGNLRVEDDSRYSEKTFYLVLPDPSARIDKDFD